MKTKALVLLALSGLLSACSDNEINQQMRAEVAGALTQECVNNIPPNLKLSDALAAKYCRCAADAALENASFAMLSDLVKNGGTPSPELQSKLIEAGSACVFNPDGARASAPSSSN